MSSAGRATISDFIRRAKIQTDHMPVQAMPFVAPVGRVRKTTKTPKLRAATASPVRKTPVKTPASTGALSARTNTTKVSTTVKNTIVVNGTVNTVNTTHPLPSEIIDAISAMFYPIWGPPKILAGDIHWTATDTRPNIIIAGGNECTAENIPETNTILIYTNNIDHIATIIRSLAGTPWADDAIRLLPSSRTAVVRRGSVCTTIPPGLFRGGISWCPKW